MRNYRIVTSKQGFELRDVSDGPGGRGRTVCKIPAVRSGAPRGHRVRYEPHPCDEANARLFSVSPGLESVTRRALEVLIEYRSSIVDSETVNDDLATLPPDARDEVEQLGNLIADIRALHMFIETGDVTVSAGAKAEGGVA